MSDTTQTFNSGIVVGSNGNILSARNPSAVSGLTANNTQRFNNAAQNVVPPYLIDDTGDRNSSDYHSSGTEHDGKEPISIPDGMSSSAQSARVNQHQEPGDTRAIGTPGTSYAPHRTDHIITSPGGQAIVMGNMPGNEVMMIKTKKGAIEISPDGSIVISAGKGLHITVGGDNQLNISGDFNIVASGAMKFKASKMIFDTDEMIQLVNGNKTDHIGRNYSQEIKGERHVNVTGNASDMIGGNHRHTVVGLSRDQVFVDRKVETGGKTEIYTKGDHSIHTKNKMTQISGGSFNVSSIGELNVVSDANTVMSTQSAFTISAKDKITATSKDTFNAIGDAGLNLDTKAAMALKAGSNVSIDTKSNMMLTATSDINTSAKGKTLLTSDGDIDLYSAANIQLNSNSRGTRDAANTADALQYSTATPPNNPEIADQLTMLDALTDFLACQASGITSINNATEVFLDHTDCQPDQNKIPDDITKRMQEKGIEMPTTSDLQPIGPATNASDVKYTTPDLNSPGVVF